MNIVNMKPITQLDNINKGFMKMIKSTIFIAVAGAIFGGLIILIIICCLCCKKEKKGQKNKNPLDSTLRELIDEEIKWEMEEEKRDKEELKQMRSNGGPNKKREKGKDTGKRKAKRKTKVKSNGKSKKGNRAKEDLNYSDVSQDENSHYSNNNDISPRSYSQARPNKGKSPQMKNDRKTAQLESILNAQMHGGSHITSPLNLLYSNCGPECAAMINQQSAAYIIPEISMYHMPAGNPVINVPPLPYTQQCVFHSDEVQRPEKGPKRGPKKGPKKGSKKGSKKGPQ